MSLVSAMNALKFAQVVLLVVENSQGKFSKLDLQIARKCLDEGRALVIAANNGDLAFFKGIGPRYVISSFYSSSLVHFSQPPPSISSISP